MCDEPVGDDLRPVVRHAGHALDIVGCVGQFEGDGNADKVDIADVGEDLGGVVGEFGESEAGEVVGIRGVEDGGLH